MSVLVYLMCAVLLRFSSLILFLKINWLIIPPSHSYCLSLQWMSGVVKRTDNLTSPLKREIADPGDQGASDKQNTRYTDGLVRRWNKRR